MRNVLASEGTRFLGVAIMEFLEKFWRSVLELGVRKPRVVFSGITFPMYFVLHSRTRLHTLIPRVDNGVYFIFRHTTCDVGSWMGCLFDLVGDVGWNEGGEEFFVEGVVKMSLPSWR